jgi:phenylacetate-CoA ligase
MKDAEHEPRTVRAIRTALVSVPFYAKQGRVLPPEGATIQEALASQPLLTRAAVRSSLPKAWLPAERKIESVAVVETGAGDARVRVLHDASWARKESERALTFHPRAREALAGDLGPYRDAVLSVPERGTGSCGAGDPVYEERLEGLRLHLNSRQDPTFWTETVMTRMLDELARHETIALHADPFYLDVLARHAAVLGRRLDVRGFVSLSRALATSAHRAAIGRVFANPVIDVYGSRATGTMFVADGGGYMHHAPFSTHVELLRAKVETPGASNVALVVATTLDREVMPLVRFVTGDLVEVADEPARLTTVAPIAAVLGAVDDAVVRPDGALVTPGAIDGALAELELRAHQVTQGAPDEAEIEVVGGSADDAVDALSSLMPGIRLRGRAVTAIAVEANGKYKSCRRQFPRSLGHLFHGVA